jgi:tetratricopeptide (TPR) repeat protein
MGTWRATQKRFKEAERFYEQALERDPNLVEALQGLVGIYVQQKQPARALARVNAQIAVAPNNSIYHLLLAKVLVNSKDLEKAEAELEKAIELDKNNMDAFLILGQVQAARGLVEQAIGSYQSAIRQNPRDVRNYVLLGALEESRSNWREAQDLYQKALQVQSDHPLAANNLAYLMLEHGGNTDVALSLAQVARRALPELPNAADTLAWAYYRKGAYALAIGLLTEAVKKLPQNPTYHYHLGLVYQKSGDQARAKIHLSRALELDPNYSKANEIRSALAQLGRP